jgi:dsDNA-binding SOS-regulon protein
MKTEVKEIPFDDSTLLGVRDESGQVWLAVKKACLDIGLSEGQARKQVENIQVEAVLKSNCRCIAIVQTEGNREVKREQLFINEKVVTLWLAKITLTKTMMEKNPKAYDKLLNYQLKAADVLHKAFYETEEQKQELNNYLGLDGDIMDLKYLVKVQTVQINNMEDLLSDQSKKMNSILENMTLTTRQQHRLYEVAKDRINNLLGGAHTAEYREKAKCYFINLWNNLKGIYCCASYKDLNPKYFDQAVDYINNWNYIED